VATTTGTTSVVLTIAQFDSEGPFEVLADEQRLADFKPMTRAAYQPRGTTPLIDATAKLIHHLDAQAAEDRVRVGLLIDRSGSMSGNEAAVVDGVNEFVGGLGVDVDDAAAGKVLAVVVTDGLENASVEYTKDQLSALIKEREAAGWTFIYLGANQDAWATTTSLGYSGGASGQSVTYTSTPAGTRSALRTTTAKASQFLADNTAFAAAGNFNTVVDEAGNETDRGAGTFADSQAPVPPVAPPTPPRRRPGYDVGDALRKARTATSKPQDESGK
jgi:uncharacterized protein YegL